MREVEGETRALVGIKAPQAFQRAGRRQAEPGCVYLAAVDLEAAERGIGNSRQIDGLALLVFEMKKEVMPILGRENGGIANHAEQRVRLLQTLGFLRINRRQARQLRGLDRRQRNDNHRLRIVK